MMKVEIYSDLSCPWCYVGERRFGRALEAFPGGQDVEVVFQPFQLDPTAPEIAVPIRQHLARRFGAAADAMLARVSDAAAGEGIMMDWDRALAVNTRTAHRLLRLAEREYGSTVQRALAERVFEAHFELGGDVSDHALLTERAVGAGLDEWRVRGYLASEEGVAEVEAEFAQALARGVQSVPTFVIDGQYVVEGAQPAATFLKLLEAVRRRAAEAAIVPAGTATDADSCADGSCAVGSDAA